jgi:hypothetical protein
LAASLTSSKFLLFRNTMRNFLDWLVTVLRVFLLKRMSAQEKMEKRRSTTRTNWTTTLACTINLKTFIFLSQKVAYARHKVNHPEDIPSEDTLSILMIITSN